MMGLGTNEMLIVGGIVVLLFGGAKLSQLGKGLGEGIRGVRPSMHETQPVEEKAAPKVLTPDVLFPASV
jgi:sec-independent protein translocase protein TatA